MKKVSAILILTGIILIILMEVIHFKLEIISEFSIVRVLLYSLLLKTLYLLFGIVFEGKHLIRTIKKKSFRINGLLLTFSICLIVLGFTGEHLVMWIGYYPIIEYNPLMNPPIRAIIIVISGILIVRSLNSKSA